MTLIQRIQDILLKPQLTWPQIEQEPADVGSLYKNYLVFLAAIPAVAGFIGLSVVGISGFGAHVRLPFMWGLTNMVVGYVVSLVMVFVMAWVVDTLAPTFGGTKNQINAMKLIAYGSTAAFVGGIFSLVPSLSMLGLLAALYSIYLVYLGIPVLMKCPPAKAAGYTALVVVCGIVAGIVIAAVSSALTPSHGFGPFGRMTGGTDVTVSTPGGEVNIDTSKMEAMARKMEEAGKRMEAAQKSGDTAATGKALSEMMGAMTGAGGEPIAPQELKALLPESLGDLQRSAVEAQGNQAMGIAGSSAKATYGNGDKRVNLSITDIGGIGGLASLGWTSSTLDRETDGKIERVYKEGQRTVREESRKDGSSGEYTLILANGVIVEARGRRVGLPALKAAVQGLDLARLETLKRAVKS